LSHSPISLDDLFIINDGRNYVKHKSAIIRKYFLLVICSESCIIIF